MMQIQETALNLVNGNSAPKAPSTGLASNKFYEKLKEAQDAVRSDPAPVTPQSRKDDTPAARIDQKTAGDRESAGTTAKVPGTDGAVEKVPSTDSDAGLLTKTVPDGDLLSQGTARLGTLTDQSVEMVPGTHQSARLREDSLFSDESALATASVALGEEEPVLAADALAKLGDDAKAKKNKARDSRETGTDALGDPQKNAAEANTAVKTEQAIENAAAFSPDALARANDTAPDGAYKGKKVAGLENTAIRVVDERGEKSVTLDVNLGAAGVGNAAAGNASNAAAGNGTGTGAPSASSFDRLLQAELQKNAGELVKAGQIVLQNNDAGTIRLVLHPEALGNVKINLRLNDGRVTGSIACASEEAYRALKETIPSLEQAFKQGGFETSGFDLSWGRSNDGGQNAQGHADRSPHPQDFAAASTEYVHGIPDALTVGENAQNRAVNLVA